MIIIPKLPEVKVEEKATLIHNKTKYSKNLTKFEEIHGDLKGEVHYVFLRNLADDSFRIQIKLPELSKEEAYFQTFPKLAIANLNDPASVYNYVTPIISKIPNYWTPTNKKVILNQNDLNEKKFSNLSKLNFGIERFGKLFKRIQNPDPAVRYREYQKPFTPTAQVLLDHYMGYEPRSAVNRGFAWEEAFNNLNIQEPEKTIAASFGEVIHFRFIKKLDFSYSLGDIWNYDDHSKEHINVKPTYEDFFIVPHKPKWTDPHLDIADIYAFYPEKDSAFADDIQKDSKTILKSSAITSLPLSFHYKPDKLTRYDFGNKDHKAIKVGSITSNEKTFYDYKNHKVEKGASTEQFDGDMIPYNFKGVYNWKLPLNINGLLKGYTIDLSENIKRPFLDVNDGKVRLKMDRKNKYISKNKKIIESFHFYKKDILSIRKRSFKNNLSLEALRRKSHH